MKQHFLVEEDRNGRTPKGVWEREWKKGARKVGCCCLFISNTAVSSTQEKNKSKNSLGSALNTDTTMKYLLLLIKAERVKPMSLLVLLMHCQAIN